MLFQQSQLVNPNGTTREQLEVGIQSLMSLMEPNYLEGRTGSAESMRRLLFAGAIVVAGADSKIDEEEIKVFEEFFGEGSFSDSLDPERLDLVLVEGFKHEPIPKIELHRTALNKPLLFPRDEHVVAVASDGGELAEDPGALPVLSINDPDEVAAFVLAQLGFDSLETTSPLAC